MQKTLILGLVACVAVATFIVTSRPNGAATTQIVKYQTALSSCETLLAASSTSAGRDAASKSDAFLIDRVGPTIFAEQFRCLSVKDEGGAPPLDVASYEFSPSGHFDDSVPANVNIYSEANIVADVPDCAADPNKCRVGISRANAIHIAQSFAPGSWTADLFYDIDSDTFKWRLRSGAFPATTCYLMMLDSESGHVDLETSQPCSATP